MDGLESLCSRTSHELDIVYPVVLNLLREMPMSTIQRLAMQMPNLKTLFLTKVKPKYQSFLFFLLALRTGCACFGIALR